VSDQAVAGKPMAGDPGGKPPGPGQLPQSLADVLALYDAIGKEFPADPAWRDQAALAERVRAAGATTAWPAKGTALKAPYAWAVSIALPVVKANADTPAVEQAVTTVTAVINEVSAVD